MALHDPSRKNETMDKIEYNVMPPASCKAIATQRLALAILGDAKRLAAAYSSCPWLIDADHISEERGQPRPSLLLHLSNYAGSDACRQFGSLISPHSEDPKSFETLVEAMVRLEARYLAKQKNASFTGSRFFQILQGIDANPHLSPAFGTQLYCSLLSPFSPYMIDGIRSPTDAVWWSNACHGEGHEKGLRPDDIMLLHAMQAGETFALLVEAMRRSPEASSAHAKAMGESFGDSRSILTRDWPSDTKKQLFCSKALYNREDSTSWRAHLPGVAFGSDPANTQLAIDAALSRLDEPFLQALAFRAESQFARAIETHRILKSTPGGCAGPAQPGRL